MAFGARPEAFKSADMTSLDYQLAILRAEASGFVHFAAALRALYLRDYPIKAYP